MDVILHDISKRYGGKSVLNKLNLVLNFGKCYAIVGASGIGKTTVLRLIAGLESADSGSLEIPENATVSYAFQEPRLFPELTVTENIKAVNPDRDVAQILEVLDLSMEADSLPSTLSGGMKLRAGLSRALAKKAVIYLIDEPTGGQDARHSAGITEAIRHYTEGSLCILSTHDPSLISALADEMIMLSPEGAIVSCVGGKTADEILQMMQ